VDFGHKNERHDLRTARRVGGGRSPWTLLIPGVLLATMSSRSALPNRKTWPLMG